MAEMSFTLSNRGGRYYHVAEREGEQVSLTQASLGRFCYHVLHVGGEVIQLWPMNPTYHRSWVGAVVAMTPEMKAQFEAATKFRLADPPQITLNSTSG